MAARKSNRSSGQQRGRQKDSARQKQKPQARKQDDRYRQLKAILLFVFAIFLLCIAIISGQNVWNWMHRFVLGLFGVCTYGWPILLGYIAVMTSLELPVKVGHKLWQSASLITLVSAAIDIFAKRPEGETFVTHLSAAYEAGQALEGGGFFGGLVGQPLYLLFGRTGGAITIFLLIFLFFMLLTRVTLVTLLRWISRPAKMMSREAREERARRLREADYYPEKKEENPDYAAYPPNKEEGGYREGWNRPPRFNIDVPVEDAPLSADKNKKTPFYDQFAGGKTAPQDNKGAAEVTSPKPGSRKFAKQDTAEMYDKSELPQLDRLITETAGKDRTKTGAVQEKSRISSASPPVDFTITADEGVYIYPPASILKEPAKTSKGDVKEELTANAARLVDTLRSFGVETRIINISRGPAVTRYELQPSAGVKISRITNLADDIALNLASAGVRIEAPIPNKPAVGIEVPNKNVRVVHIREMIDSSQFSDAKSKLTIALGRDIAGSVTLGDIAKMPHVLIAGATGSGKSVCINSIIISLLYKSTPDEVKLLMIDPKVVELGVYNGIPHLVVPVVTDPTKAAKSLRWAVSEMLKRYQLFAEHNVRDLAAYNKMARGKDDIETLPQMVIIIDELADLMMAAPGEVEDSICRLAQMARAAGMHLVIATQRPSVDVITGVIKANIPSRIAFAVSSQVDSRTILDMGGAEKLMGRGDMLFYPVGSIKPVRVQGCFVTDKEVEAVVGYVKGGGNHEYSDSIMDEIENTAISEKGGRGIKAGGGGDTEDGDDMIPAAIECVVNAGQASTSMLQRHLKLGYARAARVIDELEERGIVGPFEGSKPRKVLLSKQDWMEMKTRSDDYKSQG